MALLEPPEPVEQPQQLIDEPLQQRPAAHHPPVLRSREHIRDGLPQGVGRDGLRQRGEGTRQMIPNRWPSTWRSKASRRTRRS